MCSSNKPLDITLKYEIISQPVEVVSYLLGQYVVCVGGHGSAVGDKVRDRLHDVPRVLPPGESRQNTELHTHQAKAHPRERVSSLTRQFL